MTSAVRTEAQIAKVTARALLRVAQDGRCILCGGPESRDMTIDHLAARSSAVGRDCLGNYGLAHAACNERRGDRHLTAVEEQRVFAMQTKLAAILRALGLTMEWTYTAMRAAQTRSPPEAEGS